MFTITHTTTGYSGIDYDSAIYILSKAAKKFMSVIHEEAKCVSDKEGEWSLISYCCSVITTVILKLKMYF